MIGDNRSRCHPWLMIREITLSSLSLSYSDHVGLSDLVVSIVVPCCGSVRCCFLFGLFLVSKFQWVIYDCETRNVQLLEEFSPRPFFLKMYLPYFDMFAQGNFVGRQSNWDVLMCAVDFFLAFFFCESVSAERSMCVSALSPRPSLLAVHRIGQ